MGEFIDLGALKGNVGDQQYEIPDDVDIETLSTAVVWCRAFSIGFTSAALTAP
ncbi:MAG: DM13 domain-containing protein [Actinobacteria bacterium]|nr:DM13 domain-containing protein [Actinomycetota bacterium]